VPGADAPESAGCTVAARALGAPPEAYFTTTCPAEYAGACPARALAAGRVAKAAQLDIRTIHRRLFE